MRATRSTTRAVDAPEGRMRDRRSRAAPSRLAEVLVGPARAGRLEPACTGGRGARRARDRPAGRTPRRRSRRCARRPGLKLPDCCVLLAAEPVRAPIVTLRRASRAAWRSDRGLVSPDVRPMLVRCPSSILAHCSANRSRSTCSTRPGCAGDGLQDLLADEAGARIFLDEHGFDAPADAAARRALRETREALRALLLRSARRGPRTASTPCWPAAEQRPAAAAPAGPRAPGRRRAGVAGAVDLRGGDGDAARDPRPTGSAACANPDCVLWFLDTSRPGTRRWCSMAACGNRDKAIRHGRVAVTGNLVLNRLSRLWW